ncbi:MAG TPA: hypothetical protein VN962_21995 [Polyangia bacterium]|nr:hypothetical protein [Polyangia bacterium]
MLHPSRPRLSLLAFVLMGTAFAARAEAQEPEPAPTSPPPTAATVTTASAAGSGFGAPGTWVFSFETADNGYGFAFFHAQDKTTTLTLNPGVDYFLAPNISLGANIFFSHTSGDGGGTSFGGAVRAGYNLNLTGDIGLWPSARFFVVHHPAAPDQSSTQTAFGLFAPFLWHATTHFFLGGGPDLNIGLSGGNYTEFGLDFILGGWL